MKQPTPFENLLQSLWNPFKNFKNIFNKDFKKQRRDKHFNYSAFIMLGLLVFAHFFMKFDKAPFWVVILFGWFGAWMGNFAREWYRKVRLGYKWDWLDIWAGCYGGASASFIYILIFLK
jgi:hypothetical protein